jgi:hypothetical protein
MPTQFPIIPSVPTSFNLATYNGVLANKLTLTGTFSSSGTTVTGTNTLFTTEIQSKNWSAAKYFLYNASTGEIRSIRSISSDTQLQLNVPFASNLSGATIYGITPTLGTYGNVRIDSAVACTVGLVDQAVITTTGGTVWSYNGTALSPIYAISIIGASGTVYISSAVGADGGVLSVTGLNTDNTDPLNPIINISVDGSTITGAGTPGSPLVAAGGGGSGLAVTGLDNGATVQDQPFLNGVTVGSAGAINGVLNFKNALDSSTATISSNADKELLIDNSGHNLSLGINTAPVSGVALAMAGATKSDSFRSSEYNSPANNGADVIFGDSTTTYGFKLDGSNAASVMGDVRNNGNSTKIIVDDTAQTVAVTAANGVSTTAGMTVGGINGSGALQVPRYGDASTRDAGIPTPDKGMIIWNSDIGASGALQVCDTTGSWLTIVAT